jgi:hypothetical protein
VIARFAVDALVKKCRTIGIGLDNKFAFVDAVPGNAALRGEVQTAGTRLVPRNEAVRVLGKSEAGTTIGFCDQAALFKCGREDFGGIALGGDAFGNLLECREGVTFLDGDRNTTGCLTGRKARHEMGGELREAGGVDIVEDDVVRTTEDKGPDGIAPFRNGLAKNSFIRTIDRNIETGSLLGPYNINTCLCLKARKRQSTKREGLLLARIPIEFTDRLIEF